MKKLLLIGLIGAVALVAVVKKTNVCSYLGTFAFQVEKEAKEQIPTTFELERIRHEIAKMDDNINQILDARDVYTVDIKTMRADIARSREKIEQQKKILRDADDDVQNKPSTAKLIYGGTEYSAAQVRRQIKDDIASLRQFEKDVNGKQQQMELKEAALRATEEQVTKIRTVKRELSTELADLERLQEQVKLATIASDIKIDTERPTQIKDDAAKLKRRLEIALEKARRHTGDIVNVPLHERNQPTAEAQQQANRDWLRQGSDHPAGQPADNNNNTTNSNK